MKTKIILTFIILFLHAHALSAPVWKVYNYKKNESFNSSDLPNATIVQLSGFCLFTDGKWYSTNGFFCIGTLSYDNTEEKYRNLSPTKDKIAYIYNQGFVLLTVADDGIYADTGLLTSAYLNYTGPRYSKIGSFTDA